jgi:hypothetical protein
MENRLKVKEKKRVSPETKKIILRIDCREALLPCALETEKDSKDGYLLYNPVRGGIVLSAFCGNGREESPNGQHGKAAFRLNDPSCH